MAWFRRGATHLPERVPGRLAIHARHGVECVRGEGAHPNRVIDEDARRSAVVPWGAR